MSDAPTELDPSQPYRTAMRTLIAVRFGAVWKAVPAAIDGTDPEGVHDVRVASRRLRAAMDVATECFPNTWYRKLHQTAKEITNELGAVRDRDVLLEFLARESKSASPRDQAGLERLIRRIEAERDAAREHMLAYLSGLERDNVAAESVRRFGEEAAAPGIEPEPTGL